MNKNYYILFFICFSLKVYSQNFSGQIKDSKTNEPVPFANILIKNSQIGVVTDEAGRFTFSKETKSNSLMVSSLGYISKTVSFKNGDIIYLIPKDTQLGEVVVRFKNPAIEFIEATIKNKPQNDPEMLPYFKYKAYQKTNITANIDSLKIENKLGKVLKNNDLYINETVSHRKFLQPNLNKEIIVGSKTSGTKATLFSSITPMLQQFGFYREFITFQGQGLQEMINFLSPISKNGPQFYDYFIADTLNFSQNDASTLAIEFEPKIKANIEGLKGVMYINSANYALEYVEAEPAKIGNLHFKLSQIYEKLGETKRYFPTDLTANWQFSEFKLAGQAIRLNIRTIITDVDLACPISLTDFDENTLIINQDAAYQNDKFWQENRTDSLTFREKNTYLYHKNMSVAKKIKQNAAINATEWYASGVIPISKKLDLSIQNLLDANVYEGFRPTINILTNENFSKKIRLDGKIGYGFNDKAFKYDARIRLNLSEKYKAKLSLAYRNDISEPANVQYFIWNNPQIPYELIRTFQLARADSLVQYKAELNFRPLKHTTISFSVADETRNPTYSYKFHNPMLDPRNEMMDSFHTSEIGIGVRYAFGEAFSQVGRGSILTGVPSPTILINLVNGQLHFPEGDLGYTKINAKLEYTLKTSRFGNTFVNFTAGKIFGNVPYPYLYNGRGGKSDAGNLIWVANHFNTMGLYEFAGDKYANLFLTHSFGQLLFKPNSKWFQPDISVFQGIAFGGLNHKNYHEKIEIKTLEKGFFESGLMVDNLYRQSILKLLHIGAGIGIYNRWGNNKLTKANENWAYRLVWNVKF